MRPTAVSNRLRPIAVMVTMLIVLLGATVQPAGASPRT